MQKIVLALAGEMGSGKGAITQYLIERHGAVQLRLSDILRDILDRLHIEQSRINIATVSRGLRSAFGEDMLSRTIARDVMVSDAPLIILDGIRREGDMRYLRNLAWFVFVYVDADIQTRYARVVARGENASDATKSFADFLKDGELETEIHIRSLRDVADRSIENSGSIAELHEKIDRMYEELRSAESPITNLP